MNDEVASLMNSEQFMLYYLYSSGKEYGGEAMYNSEEDNRFKTDTPKAPTR